MDEYHTLILTQIKQKLATFLEKIDIVSYMRCSEYNGILEKCFKINDNFFIIKKTSCFDIFFRNLKNLHYDDDDEKNSPIFNQLFMEEFSIVGIDFDIQYSNYDEKSVLLVDEFDMIIIVVTYILSKNKKPVDLILKNKDFSLVEKHIIFEIMCIYLNIIGFQSTLGITSKTITELLKLKEESDDFINFFDKIMKFCHRHKLEVFVYEQFYRLVLQFYMDFPSFISVRMKKKILKSAFNSQLPISILKKMKVDIFSWFCDTDKDNEIAEIINWLCRFDKSEEIYKMRLFYESKKNIDDEFLINEANSWDEQKKSRGLCRSVHTLGEECTYGRNKCVFYHGKLEDTYGIQPCTHGKLCTYFRNGNCKFVHSPSTDEFNVIKKFYNKFKTMDDILYVFNEKEMPFFDRLRLKNPFIILKKIFHNRKNAYIIPKCAAVIKTFGGHKKKCNKPVKFMTKKGDEICNFYCCYDHMQENEPDCCYVVKQNILHCFFR